VASTGSLRTCARISRRLGELGQRLFLIAQSLYAETPTFKVGEERLLGAHLLPPTISVFDRHRMLIVARRAVHDRLAVHTDSRR
jgi:hypothetical protein